MGEEKQQTTTSIDTENVPKPILATSPIECILKCQRKLKRSFFVEERNECFCVEDEKEVILDHQTPVDGVLYKQHQVKFIRF